MVSATTSAIPVTLSRLYKAMDVGAQIMFQCPQPQAASVINNVLDIHRIYVVAMDFTDT
jgi:hypothetical protein